MNFLKKQTERQEFQEQFRSDTSGVPKHAGSMNHRREHMIRTYEETVLPKLTRILFLCMLILTAAAAAVDLKTGIPYLAQMGSARFLHNLSQTVLIMWSCWAAVLVPVCVIGMAQNRSAVRKKAREACPGAWTPEEDARCVRAARRLNRPYHFYLIFSLAGVCVLLLFFAAVRLFLPVSGVL